MRLNYIQVFGERIIEKGRHPPYTRQARIQRWDLTCRRTNGNITWDPMEISAQLWFFISTNLCFCYMLLIWQADSGNITTNGITFCQQSDAETIDKVDHRHEWVQDLFGYAWIRQRSCDWCLWRNERRLLQQRLIQVGFHFDHFLS